MLKRKLEEITPEQSTPKKRSRRWDSEERATRRKIRKRFRELCDKGEKVHTYLTKTRADPEDTTLSPDNKRTYIKRTGYKDKPKYRIFFDGRYCYCCHVSELGWKCCTEGF